MNPTVVVNVRGRSADPDVVYVGRGSEWGNDWSHRPGTRAKHIVATREEAIWLYGRDLWRRIVNDPLYPELLYAVAGLYGRTLGCYCAPLPCHADVLARAAEWAVEEVARIEREETS